MLLHHPLFAAHNHHTVHEPVFTVAAKELAAAYIGGAIAAPGPPGDGPTVPTTTRTESSALWQFCTICIPDICHGVLHLQPVIESDGGGVRNIDGSAKSVSARRYITAVFWQDESGWSRGLGEESPCRAQAPRPHGRVGSLLYIYTYLVVI